MALGASPALILLAFKTKWISAGSTVSLVTKDCMGKREKGAGSAAAPHWRLRFPGGCPQRQASVRRPQQSRAVSNSRYISPDALTGLPRYIGFDKTSKSVVFGRPIQVDPRGEQHHRPSRRRYGVVIGHDMRGVKVQSIADRTVVSAKESTSFSGLSLLCSTTAEA